MTEVDLFELYRSMFETWRSQVDSYWHRSNYFAAFETAAVARCWVLLDKKYLRTGMASSALDMGLTVVWVISNTKTHSYVRHWWDSLIKLEGVLNLKPYNFATQIEDVQKGLSYRTVTQIVSILFGIAWIILFALGLFLSCTCPKH